MAMDQIDHDAQLSDILKEARDDRDEIKQLRAALRAAADTIEILRKEVNLQRNQLANCHKEIFKLRDTLLASPTVSE